MNIFRSIKIIFCLCLSTAILAGKGDAHINILLNHPAFRTENLLNSKFVKDNFSVSDNCVDIIVLHDNIWSPPAYARIYSDRYNISTMSVPLDRLRDLLQEPGVIYIEASSRADPLLDISVPHTGAPFIWYNPEGGRGNGVIVGILDTGIDWSHPDFSDPLGSSRIMAIWDQTVDGTFYPEEFGYGTLWSNFDIAVGRCSEEDFHGHGTHVAGISAGSGPFFTGMAPEANILVVKGGNYWFLSHNIANGIIWMSDFARRRGQPIVMNLSLGGGYGPHDGTLLYERMIGNSTGPGSIVCISAGNSRNAGTHYQCDVTDISPDSVRINIGPYYSPDAYDDYLFLSGWYDGEEDITVMLRSPMGRDYGPVRTGDEILIASDGEGLVWMDNASAGPANNGDNCFTLILCDESAAEPPASGRWKITFYGEGIVHGWIYSSTLSASILEEDRTVSHIVGPPGTTNEAITVASYITKNRWFSFAGDSVRRDWEVIGALSGFSSPGPTRTGGQKPEISAPGQTIASAKSASGVFSAWWTTPDNLHTLMMGTSMSAPHVTGAVALLLQKDPTLTPSRIKSILNETATVDSFVGSAPNFDWGSGKLNISGAFEALSPISAKSLPQNMAVACTSYLLSHKVLAGFIPENVIELRLNIEVFHGAGELRFRYDEYPWYSAYDTLIPLSIGSNSLVLNRSTSFPPHSGDFFARFDCSLLLLEFEATVSYLYRIGLNNIVDSRMIAEDTIVVIFGRSPSGTVTNPVHWAITADGDTITINTIEPMCRGIKIGLREAIPEGTIVRLHYSGLPELMDSGWDNVETLWHIAYGTIYNDVVWADTVYPYYIGSLRIAPCGSLRIMPGVRVIGLNSESMLSAEGRLDILGDLYQPVNFYSKRPGSFWGGIELRSRYNIFTIKNAVLRDCRAGITMDNSETSLLGVDIRNGIKGLVLKNGSDLTARNLIISEINDPSSPVEARIGIESNRAGTIDIINATIDSIGFVAIKIDTAGTVRLKNTIISRATTGIFIDECPACIIDYSCFWNNDLDIYGPAILGPGVIYENPFFIGGTPFDYRLSAGSPCIDAGDPSMFDADSTRSDIGAFGGNFLTFIDDKHKGYLPKYLSISTIPNPFNSSCRISILLGEASDVDVNFYDITGRNIYKHYLPRSKNFFGKIDYIWSPDNLPSGIYFVRVSTESGNAVSKIIFMK